MKYMISALPLYEGFAYPAGELQKFLCTAGLFSISMKHSGEIVHHTPADAEAFRTWLLSHRVKDIREEKLQVGV